jgi:hypothetical protein
MLILTNSFPDSVAQEAGFYVTPVVANPDPAISSFKPASK